MQSAVDGEKGWRRWLKIMLGALGGIIVVFVLPFAIVFLHSNSLY